MNITLVAGARPNFIKISPIIKAIQQMPEAKNITCRLVHTGQHYDKRMSGHFFEELNIPEPDLNLGAGGGSQAEQTAAIMIGFEKELKNHRPDVVLVVGDVTSTMSCAICAKKEGVDVVHVEAGIRSYDMAMPEEINRMVTDSITDHFFTTSKFANDNLRKSGIENYRIHFVGNTMIDTLYQNLHRLRQPYFWGIKNLQGKKYLLVTLHRPSNVDDARNLTSLLDTMLEACGEYRIVFPVHPRTKKNLDEKYMYHEKIILSEPLGYLEFIFLVKNAIAVITDSGGITEETTVLEIPCITLRDSTERPETVTIGSNVLAGTDPEKMVSLIKRIKNGTWKKSSVPLLWDGKTSFRIVKKLVELYDKNQPKLKSVYNAHV